MFPITHDMRYNDYIFTPNNMIYQNLLYMILMLKWMQFMHSVFIKMMVL